MSEVELMRRIQLEASKQGHRLWRNNCGFCRDPKLRFGLCPGSSDLIGLTGGPHGGRFLSVEVKSEHGRFRSGQQEFLSQVQAMGGIGLVARCLEDFRV